MTGETFRRDSSWHYTGFIETRVLVDPAWICHGDPNGAGHELGALAEYAQKVSTPTKIHFVYPRFLQTTDQHPWVSLYLPESLTRITDDPPDGMERIGAVRELLEEDKKRFDALRERYSNLDASVVDQEAETTVSDLKRLAQGTSLFTSDLQLLDFYKAMQCDYLVTDNPWLLDRSDDLRKNDYWVLDPESILQALQLFLRAAGVFIEVAHPWPYKPAGVPGRLRVPIEGLGFGSFYAMQSEDVRAAQAWLGRVLDRRNTTKIWTYGRAAFFHRLPFLKYAHDLVRFHARWSERFAKDNRYRADHRFYVAYHLNSYYVTLAGLLDNIAWLLNYYLDLGFREIDSSRNHCVLTDRKFKKATKAQWPALVEMLNHTDTREWLSKLPLKRHPAVHREPLFLTELVEEGTGKVLSDTAGVVEESDGYTIYDQLAHVDYDMQQLGDLLNRLAALQLPDPRPSVSPGSNQRDTPTKSDVTEERRAWTVRMWSWLRAAWRGERRDE